MENTFPWLIVFNCMSATKVTKRSVCGGGARDVSLENFQQTQKKGDPKRRGTCLLFPPLPSYVTGWVYFNTCRCSALVVDKNNPKNIYTLNNKILDYSNNKGYLGALVCLDFWRQNLGISFTIRYYTNRVLGFIYRIALINGAKRLSLNCIWPL